MDKMREEAVEFRGPAAEFKGLARFRRFGPIGPVYEVLSVGAETVRVHVFDNDEVLDYEIDRAISDPVAD